MRFWTDDENDARLPRGYAPLPIGLVNSSCSKCGSTKLTGALFTDTADEADPNILCNKCGYWKD